MNTGSCRVCQFSSSCGRSVSPAAAWFWSEGRRETHPLLLTVCVAVCCLCSRKLSLATVSSPLVLPEESRERVCD